ncbi:CidA/LrgA family protein [Spirabiliibacterium falconis]|uniref:CidA/LrgA family protein n=1 Tax=Spirabiliibacterium falconis TaxID=572023 RepID=UPI001AAD9322|nr:CidA/LrgA family protein [Spirabiliibacterium falconis]MBE2894196.1 CidA/LrgA family protein [Spirabiliibacterium falconis]
MRYHIFNLLRALVILYLVLYIGIFIENLIPIGVPGSIWGLLILFFCLTTQVVKVEWIALGASLLVRYMAMLFVPVSVGIIKYGDVLLDNAQQLLIPNIVSTMLTMVVIGFLGDYLYHRHSVTFLRRKASKRRRGQA